MTKSELVEALAKQQDLSLQEAKSIVETSMAMMADALIQGDSIEIRGFGSFQVREYASYTGRNPKTGKEVLVPPKKLPFFKAGKDLREQMNETKSTQGNVYYVS